MTQLQLNVLYSKDFRNELPWIFVFCLFTFPICSDNVYFDMFLSIHYLYFMLIMPLIAAYKRHLYGQKKST